MGINLIWTIHRDGYFVANCEGHRFELGEISRGKWLLKHWASPNPRSGWHDVTCPDEGKDLAQTLAQS
jgi:hypothetical protein